MACGCVSKKQHDSLTHQKLRSVSMRPDGRRSIAIASMAFLQQIERIDVKYANETTNKIYRIDVFLRHETNRIPTNQRLQSSLSGSSRPEFTMYCSFGDFEQLRNRVARLSVGLDHSPCAYCESLYEFFIFSKYQPSQLARIWTALQPLSTSKARQVLLNKFLNELVLLSRSRHQNENPVHSKYFCSGMEQVPIVLERFLRPKDTKRQTA